MKRLDRLILFACLAAITVDPVAAQLAAETPKRPVRSVNSATPCIDKTDPAACTTRDLEQDLVMAIERDNRETALRAIAKLDNVNFIDAVRLRPPLFISVQRGQREIVAALLRKGADPLAVDQHGRLLLYSSLASAISVMPELRPEVVDCARMVLEKAQQSGRLPANPSLDASIVFYGGARNPSMELLKVFIAHGAQPNRKGWFWYDGSPLDAAIAKGNLEAIRIMIAPGARITQGELDEKAFDALTKNRNDLVTVFRSAGADPRRYLAASPKPLFDAIRSKNGIEKLEFLLKAGANPNAVEDPVSKISPLYMALRNPDKMRLLLKYGANPNAKDYSGYTVLAHLLFSPPHAAGNTSSQVSHTTDKIALVNLLLDHKAELNANIGGHGRWGALGLARREEKEVIEFLIQRGATLNYGVGKPSFSLPLVPGGPDALPSSGEPGPVTIAIEFLERDDLALALLAKSGKVSPSDRLALLQATRRGWSEVAQALLRAGADPNAADAHGTTALAVAERRKDAALVRMLSGAGARASVKSAKPSYELEGWSKWDSAVAGLIDDVALFDPPRFSLNLFLPKKSSAFVVYGKQPQDFDEIQCEPSTQFAIIANANVAGNINVGICRLDAKRRKEILGGIKHADMIFGQLNASGVKVDEASRKKLGLTHEKFPGPKGTGIDYFPVIMIGHGIAIVPTVVLVSEKDNAVAMVQADVMGLCGEGRALRGQTPLCTDTVNALVEIARRTYLRLGGQ